jgi:hypothetical protein
MIIVELGMDAGLSGGAAVLIRVYCLRGCRKRGSEYEKKRTDVVENRVIKRR